MNEFITSKFSLMKEYIENVVNLESKFLILKKANDEEEFKNRLTENNFKLEYYQEKEIKKMYQLYYNQATENCVFITKFYLENKLEIPELIGKIQTILNTIQEVSEVIPNMSEEKVGIIENLDKIKESFEKLIQTDKTVSNDEKSMYEIMDKSLKESYKLIQESTQTEYLSKLKFFYKGEKSSSGLPIYHIVGNRLFQRFFSTKVIHNMIYDIIKQMKDDIWNPFGIVIDLSFVSLNNTQLKNLQKNIDIFLKFFSTECIKNIQEIYLLNPSSPSFLNYIQSLIKQLGKGKRKIMELTAKEFSTILENQSREPLLPILSKRYQPLTFDCKINEKSRVLRLSPNSITFIRDQIIKDEKYYSEIDQIKSLKNNQVEISFNNMVQKLSVYSNKRNQTINLTFEKESVKNLFLEEIKCFIIMFRKVSQNTLFKMSQQKEKGKK
jgi:hypothetical protein